MTNQLRTPCPKCGCQPEMTRHGKRGWQAACPTKHLFEPVAGHPMYTQKAAWLTWEEAYGQPAPTTPTEEGTP